MKILVINGPNLNMLGIREPHIYGKTSYAALCDAIRAHAARRGVEAELYQSNHEGDLVDAIQRAYGSADGIVLNPGAYTHTSVALLDALKAVGIPTVEVHISDVDARETFRRTSYVRAACAKTISGHGLDGYLEAMDFLIDGGSLGVTAVLRPSRAAGVMAAPPSKSAGHRLLLCAGLAEGESVLSGIAPSEDMLATMDCLRALGCAVDYDGETARVRGADLSAVPDGALLPCRECGSTLRFFVPVALLTGKALSLSGSKKLFSRPLSVYETLCREQGFAYALGPDTLQVRGRLRAGTYTVPGNISSQFISGLLFALPLCDGDSEIVLVPPVESRPYIDMTLRALREFGVTAAFTDPLHLRVPGGQRYRAHKAAVEGDWSNAAFFLALNALGGDVRLRGLDPESPQGDKVFPRLFTALCAGGAGPLDLSDCPDLGPVCMALAAAKGGARFTGTRRLRIKESDRCAAMAEELEKFGIQSAVGEDDMTVFSGTLRAPTRLLYGHNDHRIVMALSLLLTLTGGAIEGAEAVRKSLPDFFDRLKSLGIEVETDGMDH